MLQTVLRSDDLRPEERMPRLDEVVGLCEVTSTDLTDPERIRFAVRTADLGGVRVHQVDFSNTGSHRLRRIARPCAPDQYGLTYLRSGVFPVHRGRQSAELSRGEFMVYDDSPQEVRPFADRDYPPSFQLMLLQVNRARLPVPGAELDRLAFRRLPGQHGPGRPLTRFLASIAADDTPCGPDDAARLGDVLADLLTTAVSPGLENPGRLPETSRRTAQLRDIRDYIRRNLGDPGLSPRGIAAAHHVSVRYLHQLFSDEGVTVAAWVRRQRLEQACRDLADPALADTPVHRIAARWGFADHSTFTRAFQRAFHQPPLSYRRNALG